MAVVASDVGLGMQAVGPPTRPAMTAPILSADDEATFAFLAAQRSNFCSLSPEMVMGYPDDRRLQGSCCSPMDREKYRWQVTGLRQYAAIAEVPRDPYDIPVAQAKLLLRYNESVELNAAQQATYDTAINLTESKAPCCCRCWRWYMTEGLAKFLIVKHAMAPEDVANIVGLTNGCGGPAGEAAALRLGAASAV